WGNFALSAAGLAVAALLLAGPFVLLVGRLTPKHTANQLLRELTHDHPRPETRHRDPTVASQPAMFAVYRPGPVMRAGEQADGRLGWALTTLLCELWRGSFYVLWPPALLALWRWRDRFRLVPGV